MEERGVGALRALQAQIAEPAGWIGATMRMQDRSLVYTNESSGQAGRRYIAVYVSAPDIGQLISGFLRFSTKPVARCAGLGCLI